MKKRYIFMYYFILLILISAFVACGSTSKQERTGEYVDDSVITARVKSLLAADDFLRSFQIDVETHKGTVQLSGWVNSQQAVDKAGEIVRSVEGIKSIDCALFESPVGFPIEFLHYDSNITVMRIRDTQARCDFLDIPPETYALAVIHDENMNGKPDTKWLGIPMEGYSFSNDAKAVLGAPLLSAARFPYDGQNLELTISLYY